MLHVILLCDTFIGIRTDLCALQFVQLLAKLNVWTKDMSVTAQLHRHLANDSHFRHIFFGENIVFCSGLSQLATNMIRWIRCHKYTSFNQRNTLEIQSVCNFLEWAVINAKIITERFSKPARRSTWRMYGWTRIFLRRQISFFFNSGKHFSWAFLIRTCICASNAPFLLSFFHIHFVRRRNLK